MRKVLYSPGYGAGWSTWNGASKQEKQWLCEYQPFIEYLQNNKEFPKGSREGSFDEYETTDLGMQVQRDWKAAFPNATPLYLGGMDNLCVHEVEDDAQYRVEEYDGYESVVTRDMIEDEWM